MDVINPTPAVAAVASPASPGPACSTNARLAGEPDGIARSTPSLDPQPATPKEQPSAPLTPAPKEPPGAFDLRRVDTDLWVTPRQACWDLHERLVALRHYALVSGRQAARLSRRDPFEGRVARILQYPKPLPRRASH